MTDDEFMTIVKSKNDESWTRYKAGRPDLIDRYDVTSALVHGPAVLDVGCGECLLAYLLTIRRDDIKRYVGLDPSPEMIARAVRVLGSTIEIKEGFAENLPYKAGEFDTVVLGQTLEHVRDAVETAQEAMRVLKKGGRLIVNVPAFETQPHGNHLRVFRSCADMMTLFGLGIVWSGEGRLHNFWFAWGERV